jgi:predicted Zn-dependent protease
MPSFLFKLLSSHLVKTDLIFNAKQYDEAFIHLKNSLQQDPDNLVAKILMGHLLLINGYL